MPVRSRLEGGDDVVCLSDQGWMVVMLRICLSDQGWRVVMML